jgi:membrane-associated phospholipid phosphatase
MKHNCNLVILFVFCVLNILTTKAQTDIEGRSVGGTIVFDVKTVFGDAGTIFTAPLHFSKEDWMLTSAIVGGTALLFTIDGSARSLAQRNQSSFGDNIFNVGGEYGRPIYGVVLSGGLYLGGLAFDKKDVRLTGIMVLESLGFAGAITTVLKSVAGRSRPYLEEGSTRFHGFQFKDERLSFPSGHSTVAFAVSSTLAQRLHNTFASIGLYSLATITAVSRVYNDEHWVSDSFLGAAIGTVIGFAVVDVHENPSNHSSLRFTPSFDGLKAELIF